MTYKLLSAPAPRLTPSSLLPDYCVSGNGESEALVESALERLREDKDRDVAYFAQVPCRLDLLRMMAPADSPEPPQL